MREFVNPKLPPGVFDSHGFNTGAVTCKRCFTGLGPAPFYLCPECLKEVEALDDAATAPQQTERAE